MPSDTPGEGELRSRKEGYRAAIKRNISRTWLANDLGSLINSEPKGVAAEGGAAAAEPRRYDVVIEASASFPGGVGAARQTLLANYLMERADADADLLPAVTPIPVTEEARQRWSKSCFSTADSVQIRKSLFTPAYVFASLTKSTIQTLVAECGDGPAHPVHKIWLDYDLEAFIYKSARTIKCDASRIAFGTDGDGVVWAVADSGIDSTHPHFKAHDNLVVPGPIRHYDFTNLLVAADVNEANALIDTVGHGTHVAGIIAGQSKVGDLGGPTGIVVNTEVQDGATGIRKVTDNSISEISGLAPRCKLLSLKVLKTATSGASSDLLAAIGYIQETNGYGRDVKIHGLNLSLGYPFDPTWFAAGQSPLCVEVDRLVRCGVVVVVAAGNSGYGRVVLQQGTTDSAAFGSTIADPGNAQLAITVGSTHRDRPHAYGVSYFSGKGPTADGRSKPDLVAPGERIVSCQASSPGQAAQGVAAFKEDSGTSMAAPHVSGAIAGFLSVRQEYKGRPEEVKEIFLAAATDLRRLPAFQGAGLVDIMRALQSV